MTLVPRDVQPRIVVVLGGEAMGEELMLTPETRGVNIIGAWRRMATRGKCRKGPLRSRR